MFQKRLLPFETCIALVALERSESIVLSHVLLQITGRNTNIITLTAFVGFFSCVVPHHVVFQLRGCNAWKFACCASVKFFPWVGSFVHLQIAVISCWIFTLAAMVWFLTSVFQHVLPKIIRLFGLIIALCALVKFLPSVNEGVGPQVIFSIKWLVALCAVILLDSIVDLLMSQKATSSCKSLWTLVTRFQIFHPCRANVPLHLLADH